MKIHASAGPRTDDAAAEVKRWTVETDDYEAGLTDVRAAVPAGYVLLHVMVER